MDNFICGGYIFSSNFDSGNLHKVELAKWQEGTYTNSKLHNNRVNYCLYCHENQLNRSINNPIRCEIPQ